MSIDITIRAAAPGDIEHLARLFDLYRQFYRQPANEELARTFILERMTKADSVILIAEPASRRIAGFVQLYPTYCSVSASRIFILYDLFVAPESRRKGIGAALIRAAAGHAATTHAVRLELATAKTNQAAQSLYKSLGWIRDDVFDRYTFPVAL